MFLTGAIGMLCVYISWLTAVRYAVKALDAGTTNKAAGIAVLFFIYFYSPVRTRQCLNFSHHNNDFRQSSGTILETMHLHTVGPAPFLSDQILIALQAYMVEIFPYAERSRGIAIEQ